MSKKIDFDEEDMIEIFKAEPPKAYEDIWELLEYAYKKGKLPHPNEFASTRITVYETPTVKKLLKIFENKVENKVTKYATAESKIWLSAKEIGFAKLSQWLLTEFGFAKLIKELKLNNLNELLAIKNKILTSASTDKRQYIRDSFGLLKDVLAGASGAKGKSKNDVFIRISKEQRLKLKLLSEFLGITENLTAYVCLIYALNHTLKDDEEAKRDFVNAQIYLNSDDGLIKNMDYHYKTISENFKADFKTILPELEKELQSNPNNENLRLTIDNIIKILGTSDLLKVLDKEKFLSLEQIAILLNRDTNSDELHFLQEEIEAIISAIGMIEYSKDGGYRFNPDIEPESDARTYAPPPPELFPTKKEPVKQVTKKSAKEPEPQKEEPEPKEQADKEEQGKNEQDNKEEPEPAEEKSEAKEPEQSEPEKEPVKQEPASEEKSDKEESEPKPEPINETALEKDEKQTNESKEELAIEPVEPEKREPVKNEDERPLFHLIVTCVGSKNFEGPSIKTAINNLLQRGIKDDVEQLFLICHRLTILLHNFEYHA